MDARGAKTDSPKRRWKSLALVTIEKVNALTERQHARRVARRSSSLSRSSRWKKKACRKYSAARR